jgi:tellurite resistance protein TehA-like permease
MSMEPEVKDFLKRVVLSLFLGLLWLFINMTLGIYFDLLPVYGRPDLANILFYVFFAGTGVLYIFFLYRTWKKKFPHG